jgi:NAD(P)-dependent dehydrogenase (short-subunit alcohol dehydrogenase family)
MKQLASETWRRRLKFMDFFREKVALVTGGASGIGRALCKDLGQRGATVVVADKDPDRAQEAVAAFRKLGARAEAVHLDVVCAAEVEQVVQQTARQQGRLDFMFNNAGVLAMGGLRDTGLEPWPRLLEVNLEGVLSGSAAAYAVMVRQGSGHIVNTASLGGLIPSPMLSFYAATKYAVLGFSTSLREEAANLGVKVSVVCPGFVRTSIPTARPIWGWTRRLTWPGCRRG